MPKIAHTVKRSEIDGVNRMKLHQRECSNDNTNTFLQTLLESSRYLLTTFREQVVLRAIAHKHKLRQEAVKSLRSISQAQAELSCSTRLR